MVHKIKVLPEHLASKIAAGEVVQRPASVVKELLENSLDAHATSITVVLKQAGSALIQVIDDGDGISAADAQLAFSRHSTSKIAAYEDLENIRTFGFRGEALSSIAAVAQVEMKTRQNGDLIGTRVTASGDRVSEISEDNSAVGTSVQVKNLFFNTPGRRNFLKSPSTEFHHCLNVVQRVAIAYPEVALTFISDDEKIFSLHPGKVRDRLALMFGEKLSQAIIPVSEENPYLRVTGYIGKPDFSRKTRVEQYIFLNRRFILNKSISHAVLKGYEHLLEKGSFPFFAIFLEIDPKKVDVNVHPSKMEVKFEDESAVYRFVLHAVRSALAKHDLLPVMGVESETPALEATRFSSPAPAVSTMMKVGNWRDLLRPEAAPSSRESSQPTGGSDALSSHTDLSPEVKPIAPVDGGIDRTRVTEPRDSRLRIMQLHSKYIVLPIDNGLLLVDQHAAHERVIYEQAVAQFEKHSGVIQQLLFPIVNELSAADVALVEELKPFLCDLGFSIKIFGKTTVILDGVPIDVKPGQEKTILQEILDLYKEDENSVVLEPRERLAKSYSCRAAVKAGDPLNLEEIEGLLDQLFATKIPYVCPHGRPVSIKISLDELDKRFGRTS